ncbi:MAG: hypothetical protein ABR529_13940 [Actinomycetota bacterium]
MSWGLRITTRCLVEDLEASRDAVDASESHLNHELVRAFVAQRSQDPAGVEKIQPIPTRREVYTLHAGRWRGATWHDRANNVVWLLAVGFHRSGEHSDVYPYVKGLAEAGRLLPSELDYQRLFEAQDRQVALYLGEDASTLARDAALHVGTERRAVLCGLVEVSALVEVADGMYCLWVAVSMSLRNGSVHPPKEWLGLVLAGFFPDIGFEDLQSTGRLGSRSLRDDEVLFGHCWEGEPS